MSYCKNGFLYYQHSLSHQILSSPSSFFLISLAASYDGNRGAQIIYQKYENGFFSLVTISIIIILVLPYKSKSLIMRSTHGMLQ